MPEKEETVDVVSWPEGIMPGTLYQLEYEVDPEEKKVVSCYRGGADDLYHLYLKHTDGSLETVCAMHYEKSDD